jgi:hypothetical protein|tara:strand:+ start:190 stop:483 length:294 start_codon:yes stop_codon:yes gene_type:complete
MAEIKSITGRGPRKLADWAESLENTGEAMLVADGFEEAFMGVTNDWGPPRAVYSYDHCLQVLERDMNYLDAIEYMEFNVVGAYVGEQTPIFVRESVV